jgi:2-polyprenyl-6-methoxyphenol hydroxylase-like FAD-dependent oxidoreductase
MVNSSPAPSQTDVFVIGGGPAGLATALAARQHGFEVAVADRAQPPIDKACGEGLMPDGLAALRRIGVELDAERGASFRGIRFLDDELEADASFPFPEKCGLGIRRTLLHQILMDRVQEAGVVTCWHSHVEALDHSSVKIDGRTVRCRWIIGADGFHSKVRQWSGLLPIWSGARRIGLRQHFRVQRWTDFVEVYWHDQCQAYVTPVGPAELCIAMIGSAKEVRVSDLPTLFPALAKRLGRAEPMGTPRGAISMSVKLPAVTRGRIALVGDASGSVDAVTGEGLALTFRQASVLATSLAAGDLGAYEAAHRQIGRMPRLMARLLLLMDGSQGWRRRALHTLATHPRIFNRLLAAHVGAAPPSELSLGILDFAFRLLASPTVLGRRA